MSVSAAKQILWALIAIAVGMLMALTMLAIDHDGSRGMALGAGVFAVFTALWYRHFIPGPPLPEEERLEQRLHSLKHQLRMTGRPIAVTASNTLPPIAVGVFLVTFYAHKALTNPGLATVAVLAVIVVVATGLLVTSLPRLGKPAIAIQTDGVNVPVYGLIPWAEIESVGLQRYSRLWFTTYWVELSVPRLRSHVHDIHPILRVLWPLFQRGASHTRVVIPLVSPSLRAELVYALCHDLTEEAHER